MCAASPSSLHPRRRRGSRALDGRAGGGGGRGGVAPALFTAADANKDGAVSREELKTTFDSWFSAADTSQGRRRDAGAAGDGYGVGVPAAARARGSLSRARIAAAAAPIPRRPAPNDVQAMMAALPATAPAKPKQPRKILVLGAAQGFVHSSIPLAAKTIEAMGEKTKAWTAVTTYDPADINEQNLKQYDAVFLDSTTGCFLDDPMDKAATAARRKALMDFVRSGKGIAGIHASTDSYHRHRVPRGSTGGGPRRRRIRRRARRRRQRSCGDAGEPGRQERAIRRSAATN